MPSLVCLNCFFGFIYFLDVGSVLSGFSGLVLAEEDNQADNEIKGHLINNC